MAIGLGGSRDATDAGAFCCFFALALLCSVALGFSGSLALTLTRLLINWTPLSIYQSIYLSLPPAPRPRCRIAGTYKDKYVPADASLPDMTGGVDAPDWDAALTNGEKLNVLLTRCKYTIYNLTKLPMGPPKRYRLWMALCGNKGAAKPYDLDYDDQTVEFGTACDRLQKGLHFLYRATCCTCHEISEIFKGVRSIEGPPEIPKTRSIPIVGKCDDLPQYWMGYYASTWYTTVSDYNMRFCLGCGSSEAGALTDANAFRAKLAGAPELRLDRARRLLSILLTHPNVLNPSRPAPPPPPLPPPSLIFQGLP